MGGEDDYVKKNAYYRFADAVYNMVDGPVVWFRKTIVEPNRQDYPWYHQKYRRVPTIDQCFVDDPICQFEADKQFKRDRKVDNEVLSILRQRFEDCILYEAPDQVSRCSGLKEEYDNASTNWFIKYGDLGGYGRAERALIKQKHRVIWERRHGPVGSGMKQEKSESEE